MRSFTVIGGCRKTSSCNYALQEALQDFNAMIVAGKLIEHARLREDNNF